MDWLDILRWVGVICIWIVCGLDLWSLNRSKKLIDNNLKMAEGLKKTLDEMPDVVDCYCCRFYLEEEPFCPKSGMKMKDGLIFCCYGERKEEGSDEGKDTD